MNFTSDLTKESILLEYSWIVNIFLFPHVYQYHPNSKCPSVPSCFPTSKNILPTLKHFTFFCDIFFHTYTNILHLLLCSIWPIYYDITFFKLVTFSHIYQDFPCFVLNCFPTIMKSSPPFVSSWIQSPDLASSPQPFSTLWQLALHYTVSPFPIFEEETWSNLLFINCVICKFFI